jgi:murein DD-endopeptidase MepM/ murein hydrolase activator NlpD
MQKKVRIGLMAALGVVAVAVVFFVMPKGCSFKKQDKPITDTIAKPLPVKLYGIPRDSFAVATQIVRNNQFLSDIFTAVGLPYQTIDGMVSVSKPLFDFRKMNVGHKFTFFYTRDSLHRLKHAVYEIDRIKYIALTFGDSVTASLGQKEIVHVEKSAAGKIRSSLWKTIQENNFSPALAIQLSDVFAWSVDFFGIEKGDYFKVLYREDFVEGESIGIDKIHAAIFSHHKKLVYAFNFEQDSVWDFFDENGQSLRKAFLKAPLKFSRISSRFSNSRFHPILKIFRAHHGIDYAAPTGTPVHSIGDGRVVAKGWDGKGGGNFLKITHNSVYTTVYMHLSGFGPGIVTGAPVKQGQLIGFVGSTGLASGPHLDFRVFQNGSPIDPLKVESPPVEPVKPQYLDRYKNFVVSLKKQLDEMPFD